MSRSSLFIESMESRLHMDVTQLTETIVSSTLPAVISDHAVLHGTVVVSVANNSGVDEKEKVIAGVEISNGVLVPLSGQFGILKNKTMVLVIKNGQSKLLSFPVNIAKGKLADGVDTITALVVNEISQYSQSAPGGTLSVHPPIVILSETEAFAKLPDTLEVGAPLHFADKVGITNSGTDPSQDVLTVGVYATPDGLIEDGVLINSITRKIVINAGKTVNVQVPLPGTPALSVGTYKLVTQVTQPLAVVTTTDPTTAPTFTVTVPTVGPSLDATISKTTETDYEPEPLDGAYESLTEIHFLISVVNTGDSTASTTLTLFASNSPTFGGDALQIGQISLAVPFPHKGTRLFNAFFGVSQDVGDLDPTSVYIFVQIADATGGTTMAALGSPIKLAGLIAG